MNREWTPGLRQARKRLISIAKQEMQLFGQSEVLEFARQMLKANEFSHSHFSDQVRQPDCAGCLIELLMLNLPDFGGESLEGPNAERTVGIFKNRLEFAQFSDLQNDEYWNHLQNELENPSDVVLPKSRHSHKPSKRPVIDEPGYVWPTGRGTDPNDFWPALTEIEKQEKLEIRDRVLNGKVGDDPISLGGEVVREQSLPLAYVMYPPLGGSIPSFSSDGKDDWTVCACHRNAITGITSLSSKFPKFRRGLSYNDVLRREISIFANLSDEEITDFQIPYTDKVCHFCNQVLPNLATFTYRYPRSLQPTDVLENPPFWGLYFRIECLRNGIQPSLYEGEDNCWNLAAPDVLQCFEDIKAAGKAYHQFRMSIDFPVPKELMDEWMNVNYEASNSWSRLYHLLENRVRTNFGIRPIGATGQQEDLLYKLIVELFPRLTIQRNYRPGWLERLELDVWIPELSLGIEYQGEQHYVPIEAWGGVEKLNAQQERDRRKVDLCAKKGVTLIEFRFDEKLTKKLVRDRLAGWVSRSE